MSGILALLLAAQDPAIDLRVYRARLAEVRSAIEAGDLPRVRREAGALGGVRVRSGDVEVIADPTVVGPLAKAGDLREARAAAGRLDALIAALDAEEGAEPPPPSDPARLERIRAEEAASDPSRGGPAGGPQLHAPRIPRSWGEWAADLLKSLGERLKDWLIRFLKWLFGAGGSGGTPEMTMSWRVALLLALIVGVLGLAVVLALRRLRKGPLPEVAPSDAPAPGARDEDPLSRTATEWERFAADLARAGRYREAIRAWYHAVLVTLFRAGALQYRRDRTNWEYAYALPPGLPWRGRFVDATRTFEREWYGRRDTPAETLGSFAEEARRLLASAREGAAP